ncbi:hypothetical protein PC116_g28333 [Phytophthora cactorum]|nr:hypothetical protein PC116_g28333 [Phytophthora cactorum]
MAEQPPSRSREAVPERAFFTELIQRGVGNPARVANVEYTTELVSMEAFQLGQL